MALDHEPWVYEYADTHLIDLRLTVIILRSYSVEKNEEACRHRRHTCQHTLLHYPHGANAGCDLAGVAPVHVALLVNMVPYHSPSHWYSFENRYPVDFIYEYRIFKINVAWQGARTRVPTMATGRYAILPSHGLISLWLDISNFWDPHIKTALWFHHLTHPLKYWCHSMMYSLLISIGSAWCVQLGLISIWHQSEQRSILAV